MLNLKNRVHSDVIGTGGFGYTYGVEFSSNNSWDLYLALHGCSCFVNASRYNTGWDINYKLSDVYNFEHWPDGQAPPSVTAVNNFAEEAMRVGAIVPYMFIFRMKEFIKSAFKKATLILQCMSIVAICLVVFWAVTPKNILREENYVSFVAQKWDIALPLENYSVCYTKYPDSPGIQGDGDRFHIIVYAEDISEMLNWQQHEGMWDYFQKNFFARIASLQADPKYLPDSTIFESGKIFYFHQYDQSELFIVYLDEVYLNHTPYKNVMFLLEHYE